jgi:hypothetical protein
LGIEIAWSYDSLGHTGTTLDGVKVIRHGPRAARRRSESATGSKCTVRYIPIEREQPYCRLDRYDFCERL